jgi:hypothetical protein
MQEGANDNTRKHRGGGGGEDWAGATQSAVTFDGTFLLNSAYKYEYIAEDSNTAPRGRETRQMLTHCSVKFEDNGCHRLKRRYV